MKLRKIIKIILLVFWMGVIFTFSHQKAYDSSKLSDTFIVRVTKIIVGHKPDKKEEERIIKKYVNVVRKSAHVFVYIVLSILIFTVLIEYFEFNKRLVIYSIIFCLLYSISDEVHQLFILGRSGEIRDVLLDTTASSVTAIINFYIRKIRRNKLLTK